MESNFTEKSIMENSRQHISPLSEIKSDSLLESDKIPGKQSAGNADALPRDSDKRYFGVRLPRDSLDASPHDIDDKLLAKAIEARHQVFSRQRNAPREGLLLSKSHDLIGKGILIANDELKKLEQHIISGKNHPTRSFPSSENQSRESVVSLSELLDNSNNLDSISDSAASSAKSSVRNSLSIDNQNSAVGSVSNSRRNS